MTPPTIRAELATAIRRVNVEYARLPVNAQREIDPRTDPVEDEMNAAILADDRDRALAAIRAWQGYWLDRIGRAGR